MCECECECVCVCVCVCTYVCVCVYSLTIELYNNIIKSSETVCPVVTLREMTSPHYRCSRAYQFICDTHSHLNLAIVWYEKQTHWAAFPTKPRAF